LAAPLRGLLPHSRAASRDHQILLMLHGFLRSGVFAARGANKPQKYFFGYWTNAKKMYVEIWRVKLPLRF
jgi:hypothetical protein